MSDTTVRETPRRRFQPMSFLIGLVVGSQIGCAIGALILVGLR